MKIWRVPYPKFGQGIGLARVSAIAAQLGLDLAAFGAKGAVITGSNGKGSTAAMTASILRQTGASVGLFTSPHLFALNERFAIDGEDISDEELDHHWRRVQAAANVAGEAENLGGFEFLFLIAADWFAARACAHTIWEAGIGGRHDPVRLIEARRTALTSLDYEHTDLLGDTLEEIACDKLDAAPAGATVFVSTSCQPQRAAIEAHGASRMLHIAFTAPEETLLSLTGSHQHANAALAAAIARDIAGDALTHAMIANGLAATRWPGRLEILAAEPLIVIDAGHTPRAIAVALDAFKSTAGERGAILVCGASSDKNADALISALARAFTTIICVAAHHKGRRAAEIAAIAQAAHPEAEITIADSIAQAHALALAKARAPGSAIYVAGGLFLAAEFKAAHLGRDPAQLVFF